MVMIKKPIAMIKAANQTMRAWYSEDLKKHDQLMALLNTYHKVQLSENDSYPEKLSWCLEHCRDKFRDIKHGDGMLWYFKREEDATMFALRWL
jgi:hypothetical protein